MNESSSVAAVHIRFSEPAPAGPVGPVHGQSPPQFGYPYYVMRYTNAPVLGDTTATDADGDNLTYALHSAPPWIAGAKVNNNTFRIQVAAGATPVIGVHTFQAVVEDGNLSGSGQPQGDAATVVVIVDPAGNGSAPVFSSNTYNVTLTLQQLQDATPGSLIATNQFVTANDPQNQTVTYSTPTSGASFGNPISVHPTTGEVFVNVSGILEPNSNRAIVIAEDPDHYTDTAEIVVTVQGLTGYQLYVQGAGDSHEIAGNDVQQGGLGNCWFQSVLAAIADQSPQVIQAMIVDEGNFDFKVRFFQKNAAGQLAPIWVDVHFNPQGTSGVAVGADIDAAGNAEIWPRIVEAAYIQFVGGPANVTGGTPATSWEMITGYPANPTQPANSLNAVLLQQLLNAGQLVWVGTKPGPILVGGLAPNHIYNVVSYDAQTGFVTLANPHGTNHSTMTLADLLTAIQEWWRQ